MYLDLHVKYASVFNETELSRNIFENYSHVKFDENPSTGSHVVQSRWPDEQTDKHDEANIRYSQYFERA
jgi:hypothetical protein